MLDHFQFALIMDLTHRFLCNISLYSLRLYFHRQLHPQLDLVFAVALSLHSFWSYFLLISSSILGTYWPGEFIFQCSIFLPFHTVHGVLKARILKAEARLLQWSRSVAKRSYSTSKVRGGGQEELPHIQGKEQQLCFVGATVETPYVQGKRNLSNMVGTERGHQRANRLKPQSQKTGQSDCTDHSLV